jgi:glutathionylspermidine synthase
MRRFTTTPRDGWRETVESQGFHFHTIDEKAYWDEGVYYQFTPRQIDALEAATYELNDLCLEAVQHVIDEKLFHRFQIPLAFEQWIIDSWDRDEQTIYGRFDFAYDGVGPPKLLEYNADTPTSLLEAAVIQWHWMKDKHPTADQFNSIHERLIEAWKQLAGKDVTFASISGNLEDFMTTQYLRDTAMQAGVNTQYLEVETIGWNGARRCFVDETEKAIDTCFKLYPWEWLIREQFGPQLRQSDTKWLEPPWKMLLSNKAILPILYELFPGSPHLLPASFDVPTWHSFVRKPILSREGANVAIFQNGQIVQETPGQYSGPYVYQQFHALPRIDGYHPLVGSWMVNGYACGIGIREDPSAITGNTSRFVPHIFR